MARTLPTAFSLLAAVLLTGCASVTEPSPDTATGSPDPGAPPVQSPSTAAEPLGVEGLPVMATPEVPGGRDAWEACPYLDTDWVAETNGQRVTGVGIDSRFATPACVFWSYPEEPQLTVLVREMADADAAIAVVDHAAPIATTEPAEDIAGWSGGRAGAGIGGHDTAVYAVQKNHLAVVVDTNQEQSLKAELVAREVISNLGL